MGRGGAVELEQLQPAPVKVKYAQLLIDGKWVDAVSGKKFPTVDPRSGELIVDVAEADKADVDLAVAAARRAFDEGPWPRLSGSERGRILCKLAGLIEDHAKELAALETMDSGKPIGQSEAEVYGAAKKLRYFAGWADKINGLTLPTSGPYQAYTLREPIGVVGGIIPWNFPLVLFSTKVAPALAVGNTLVVKPAEQTPLTALYAAQLALEAGIPAGVLNVLPGYGPTAGAAICSHRGVDKVTFTGSTEVGRLIMEAAGKSNLKPVTLELGGKSPIIICEDADLDNAVEIAHNALFFNQGQCCCAGTRIFVQEGVYDEFVKKSAERASKRVLGDPFKAGVDQGPQVDDVQFNKILEYIDIGKQQGAKLMCGGNRFGNRGFFIEPTVFAGVEDNMTIAKEEIFGPVMSILKFKTLEEVIKRANDTTYGLAAGIFTKSLDTSTTLSRAIRAGTIWVNCYYVFDDNLPFGGYKESGFGRENGPQGLDPYLQVKAVVSPITNPTWL
eukprot:TRINITY_DN10630_c0_g3_i1.p1 TRINITY_DN10630_c0_g3~~TRINITY_DN10630_c0_g3_i1.p1  ORF type:complete len:502 (-),score=94.84 TRINITY_DN10630_c0_g3_i1:336-1841(-)